MAQTVTLTIRLNQNLLDELRLKAKKLNIRQSDYIKKAINNFNHKIDEAESDNRLEIASLAVRDESLRINQELDEMQDDFFEDR